MSEDQDLLAKISQLAGHINRHKTQNTRSNSSDNRSSIHPYAENSVGRGFGRGATAYGRARGRGRAPVPHRNRTLVLNTSGSQTPTTGNDENAPTAQSTTPSGGEPTASASGWVAKRDRHMQLINTSIYDKETQARVKAIEETRKLKARQRDERERSKIHKHLQRLAAQKAHGGVASKVPGATSNSVHEILIHDIPFRVANGGSKLIKLSDSSSARATPKKATVGGVVFVRSKNGNLYRSGIVKAKRSKTVRKIAEPCKRFTTTGSCSKGPLCPFIHDADKVAICKDFLQTGNCPAGDACDLSHDPTPERVPACLHFLRGKCSNPECRYAHVHVTAGAPVCRPFATLGFCEKGANCSERHVHECPDYANSGICHNKKCRLPHIDRAGQKRKQRRSSEDANMEGSSGAEESDISSEEEDYDEIDSDDVDSDGLEEDFTKMPEQLDEGEVSHQQDFIHF